MKIYTRTGDTGTTALFGGDRVSKSHPRIDAYGTVDETNSFIGLARAVLSTQEGDEGLVKTLTRIQEDLFVLGADLATPLGSRAQVPRISEQHVLALEADIDAYDATVPSLKHFILPGGTQAASLLHVARTVCRRTERLAVESLETETLNDQAVVYLNRLSDLLFVLARWANHQAHIDESEWKP